MATEKVAGIRETRASLTGSLVTKLTPRHGAAHSYSLEAMVRVRPTKTPLANLAYSS
jgi:hypothetical protein